MGLVTFHAPNGHIVECLPSQVGEVREPLPHEMVKGCRTILTVSGAMQGVTETVAQVDAILKGA
jgi:hypothetical protein